MRAIWGCWLRSAYRRDVPDRQTPTTKSGPEAKSEGIILKPATTGDDAVRSLAPTNERGSDADHTLQGCLLFARKAAGLPSVRFCRGRWHANRRTWQDHGLTTRKLPMTRASIPEQ